MTKDELEKLDIGTALWFRPDYFAFPMVGVVKQVKKEKGIWINFFGEGQCFFPFANLSEKNLQNRAWLCHSQTDNVEDEDGK